jgi:SAM-dependent methyltransferase
MLVLTVALSAQHQEHQEKKMPQHGAGEHMHRRFDNAEQWATNFDDPARDQWQMPDRVIATLRLKPGQSVADIGAGTGYLTSRLAKSAAAPKVFAADLEADMVAYLKKRAEREKLSGVTVVQAGEASPNLPEPVDLIILLNTYHHIPNREAYFRALAKSLKPGGRLAIVDWKPGAPMGPPDHFRFTPERLTAELAKAGYHRTEQHDFLPNQSFLVFVPR